MKKEILFCIVFTVIFKISTANAFYDVNQTDKYYPAIDFLQKHNVISGYEDGTFKPSNVISRAEFVKIIIKSIGLQTNSAVSEKFKDIDETAWYAPYINKAQAEGILNGYTDGTFRPSNPVTKAEALKIIGAAQKWNIKTPSDAPFIDTPITAWFTPYVEFAKTNKLIEQSRFFQPDAAITRSLVSDILYKSDLNGIFKIPQTSTNSATIQPSYAYLNDNFKPLVAPITPRVKNNEGNIAFEMINKDFFDNISLDSDFPSQFYKNEIYKFKGSIKNGAFDSIFIFLAYKDENGNSKTLDFVGNVQSNKFEIPVIFRYPGIYDIGIIPGTAGSSKIKKIVVIDNAIQTKTNIPKDKPSNIKINFSLDKTTLSFSRPALSIIKITFAQEDKTMFYISRQQEETIDIQYQDFYQFKPGIVVLKVESASTSSLFPLNLSSGWGESSISFTATRHLFSKIDKDKISISGLKNIMPSPGQISISGITNAEISRKAIIINSNGLVEEVNLNSPVQPIIINGMESLPKGSAYSLSYQIKSQGTYILGINEISGAAVVNTAIYVGSAIPLLPDFFDIKDLVPEDKDLTGASNKYINYVNNARQRFGLNPVKLDNDLVMLAQSHADDMAKNNYFSHYDLRGRSPNDRRIIAGIPTEVGENMAKSSSLTAGFEGLMRSPGHRQNILRSSWTKVGFGFSKNTNGEIFIVQEFSSDPISQNDILKLKNELLIEINNLRKNNSLPELRQSAEADEIAQSWSSTMANDNFTDLKGQNGSSLTNMIQSQMRYSFVQMFVYSQNTTDSFKENILGQLNVLENNVSYIGIGIAASKLGDIKTTIILFK